MIKKYVLDPEAILDSEALIHFVRGLGVDKGRLLAHYPGKWHRKARMHVDQAAGTLDAMRIREAISFLELNSSCSVRSEGVPYDGTLKWAENVAMYPDAFAAGLYADGAIQGPSPPLYPVSTLIGSQEPDYWQVSGWVELSNNLAPTVVAQLTRFLELEKEAVFMDPYFYPSDASIAFVREILKRISSLQDITLHSGKNETSGARWRAQWWELLRGHIPEGRTVTIVRWGERDNNRPHKRWVINARGGITSDRGFPSVKRSGELRLQAADEAMRYWNEFGRGPWSDGTYYLNDVVRFNKSGALDHQN